MRINPETNTLVREGVQSIINPFDMYAIEEGLRMRERLPGKVTVITMGPPQAEAALREGLRTLETQHAGFLDGIQVVCSDMWKPYLRVIAQQAGQALHILDRFHIVMHLNQALDQVRRAESARLLGAASARHLKKMRWKLLRRGSRVRGKARHQLNDLAASKLATARAWILKETFQPFWRYRSTTWAGYFLSVWTERALRSRLEPMKKVARMLRSHEK